MKVRPADATMGRSSRLLGGTNVQASAPEAREVLERGVADAITFPWQSIILFGIDKVTKYHMDMPFWTATFVWAMNKAKYDAMSPAQKAVIDSHCTTEWAEKVASPWADWEHGGRDKLAADGRARGLQADAGSGRGLAQGGGAAEGEVGVAGEGRRCGVRRIAGRAEEARRARGMRTVCSSERHPSLPPARGGGELFPFPGYDPSQPDGSLHRRHRAARCLLRRHRRGRHLHLGAAALLLRRVDPRQLRLRQAAAGDSDLLGHRRDQLSRHAYHGGPGLGGGWTARQAADRYLRHAGTAVRGQRADRDAVRQGAADARRQRADLRPAAADLAVRAGGVARRCVRRAADRGADVSADLPSRRGRRRRRGRPVE